MISNGCGKCAKAIMRQRPGPPTRSSLPLTLCWVWARWHPAHVADYWAMLVQHRDALVRQHLERFASLYRHTAALLRVSWAVSSW